jgi:cysteine desulfuration protein SufE
VFEYISVINRDDLAGVSLAELRAANSWQQQYKLIIQWGKLITSKPELRLPANLIKGCELPVWLVHEQEGEQHYLVFDSDSSVMNGLAALLLVQLNGKTAAQIAALDLPSTLIELGFDKHLTPSRNNGFKRIMERTLALAAD